MERKASKCGQLSKVRTEGASFIMIFNARNAPTFSQGRH
jgi:hypothetical protein